MAQQCPPSLFPQCYMYVQSIHPNVIVSSVYLSPLSTLHLLNPVDGIVGGFRGRAVFFAPPSSSSCRPRSLLSVPSRLPRPLLQQRLLSIRQDRRLPVVDALQPVAEAGTARGVDGVDPEGALVEEGAHLDADLPEAYGGAYIAGKN